MAILEIKNLHKKFKENIVLNGVDLVVNKGDIIGIVGPSGTGKSTLLRSINLLERPEEGEITIGETTVHLPLTRKEKKEAFDLRRHTGMVFQKFGLF
jgi:ABC-type polar amino acid transport system ATPase subunit